MNQTVLKAEPRTGSPKQARKAGFIPGVLHGSDTTSTPVQFERSEFIRILTRHGSNAKVWIDLGKEKHFGIFKEIQKDPLDKSIIHVTVHLVSQDREIKVLTTIMFSGREELENRRLMLQTVKEHVELVGKAASMPEAIHIDVTGMQFGDTVTAKDIQVPKGVRLQDNEDELYAVIKDLHHASAAETTEAAEEAEQPEVTHTKPASDKE